MELRHYLRMLGRGWWIITLAALSGLVLALARSYVTKPEYKTRTRLLLSPNLSQVQSGQELYSVQVLQNRTIVGTISEILNSGTAFRATGDQVRMPPREIFHYKNTAVTIPDANVIDLFVSGPDAATTALLANSMAQRMIDEVNLKYPVYSLTVLDPALVPSNPEKPKPTRDALLAMILGAVLGAVLAIIQEQLRLPLEAFRRRNMTDSVSTAYTRRYFDQQSKEVLGRVSTASLALVYLDGMQDVMDTMSPLIVQRTLRQVKTILRNELRGNDLIGRWDPTTFAVLLPDTPEAAATRTLDRIMAALSQPMEGIEEEPIRLQPYAGGATRQGTMTYAQLTEEAEAALARSYRTGERNVTFGATQATSAQVSA